MNNKISTKQILLCSLILALWITPNSASFLTNIAEDTASSSLLEIEIPGFQQQGSLGYSVSAGDVNGDGFSDVIITSYITTTYNPPSAAFILYGNKEGVFPTNLINLTSSQGFKIFSGNILVGGSTLTVNSAGDFNGDGVDDIIIGSTYTHPFGRYAAGTAFIVFGAKTRLGNVDLSKLTSSQGIKIFGASTYDNLGASVSGAGDINGDGIDDVIIGACSQYNYGLTYVIYGSNNSLSNIDLKSLTQNQGFTMNNASENSLTEVSRAGDINRDGIADVIIGLPSTSPLGRDFAGTTYVIFGKIGGHTNLDLQNLSSSQGFKIMGQLVGDSIGSSVSAAGDVNADGIDDILIGSDNLYPVAVDPPGNAYVIYGSKNEFSDIDLGDLTHTQGFKITGAEAYGRLGSSVSGTGDVNGDGIDDIVVGASNTEAGIGTVYVIFGSKNGLPNIDAGNLAPSQGVVIESPDFERGFGSAVSGAGDVNGDGVNDIVIGSAIASPNGIPSCGAAYIVLSIGSSTNIASDFI